MLSVDLAGLHGMLEQLGDRAEAAARPAAQAAAQVLYDAVKENVAALGRVTGNLDRSLYQAYSASNSGPGHATYHVSWNPRKAPHGGLVEFGYIQRYKTYVGRNGQWYTAVRPEMRGKPRPKRRASQAVKDAYYVPLPAPRQVAANPFVRKAVSKFTAAVDAAKAELMERLA